jgi:hypothetical protein
MGIHPGLQKWEESCPRLAWAFSFLHQHDPLKDRTVAAVLSERLEDPVFNDLEFFAEALEGKAKSERKGTRESPPAEGERRAFEIYILRMMPCERYNLESRNGFRVFFTTNNGWSGYFDTKSPLIVERVSKLEDRSQPLTVVGEVLERRYDFLVVLESHIRIV